MFAAIHRFLKSCDGERMATLSMRWARPVFFMLLTILLIVGWWYPERMDAYFTALSKVPDWLAQIITILVLGLAIEKGLARPIADVIKAVKGP
ncbi:hypothetical protein GRI62_11920 [Erythrobacter arachoides]|uniref:Uncharacterized protein n=1 Tax=Aurantiacibacter arachoides TaxID=1850444 RepID=A0A845A198_9SPHN|nr:hypothetical protein [Aurantiacibacter arachoides]MXO94303.1 hypothetical protein [Aurantiacibacter arachoides]GGD64527.1 hypothetical protein GCM10011411_26050 [Aurantiacibacter arachoides]